MYTVLRLIADDSRDTFFNQVVSIFHKIDPELDISKHRKMNQATMSISSSEDPETHLLEIVQFTEKFQVCIRECKRLNCEIQCDLALDSIEKGYYSFSISLNLMEALITNQINFEVTVYPPRITN